MYQVTGYCIESTAVTQSNTDSSRFSDSIWICDITRPSAGEKRMKYCIELCGVLCLDGIHSMSVFLSVPLSLSVYPPVGLSACRPVGLSACPPVRLSACPPVRLSACPPVRLSACPPVRLSACRPVRLSTCRPVRLSTYSHIRLSACPPVRLSYVFIYRCVRRVSQSSVRRL